MTRAKLSFQNVVLYEDKKNAGGFRKSGIKRERNKDNKRGAKDASSPTDMAGTTEFPFALLMSAAESEKERFSDELPGVSTVPGDLGGSGLYRDVCLCNANNFFGLRSWDCSLIVLRIRLV